MAQMADKRFHNRPDLVPLPLRRKKLHGKWNYEYIPEVFGDFLRESAQLFNALLTQASRKHRAQLWQAPAPGLEKTSPKKSSAATLVSQATAVAVKSSVPSAISRAGGAHVRPPGRVGGVGCTTFDAMEFVCFSVSLSGAGAGF